MTWSNAFMLIEGLQAQLIYIAIVALLTLLGVMAIRRLLRRLRDHRLARLDKLQNFNPVDGSAPVADPEALAKRHARRSITTRFTIIQHTLVVAMVLLAILFACFPLLDSLPQAFVSLLMAVGVAVVGIAARPLVENFISGIVISVSKHLRVGDTVLLDGEFYGNIEDITPTHTVVKLWDWQRYIVPNSRMLQKEFQNLSHRDSYLWAHVAFTVAHDTDIEEVERIATEAARSSERFAGHDAPELWVRDMLPDHLVCWIAGWVDSPEDAWYWRSDVRKRLVRSFQQAGIRSQLQHLQLPPRMVTGRQGS